MDGIAFVIARLHRVRRRVLFGEADDDIRVLFTDQRQESVVMLGNVKKVELDLLSGDFLPRGETLLDSSDGRERLNA